MAREPRPIGSKKKKAQKKDWTFKLETAKIFIYILQIILVILYIIRSTIDDMDEIREGYFNLLDVLVPLSLLIVLLGVEEVLISTMVGAFRKDLSDRFRYLETAKRGAVTTAIVALIVAILMMAPPIHDMIEDATGISETMAQIRRSAWPEDDLRRKMAPKRAIRTPA